MGQRRAVDTCAPSQGTSGPGQRQVVGRFAPSPSGRMHLGNLFSALLAWLSARSQSGVFLLRHEDLDERCRDSLAAAQIEDDLSWLGLDTDGEAVVQSACTERYAAALSTLRERAEVYECFCSRADLHVASAPHASDGTVIYPGTCRSLTPAERDARRAARRSEGREPALRLHVPDEVVAFEDLHAGSYSQELASECGDFVVKRSDGVFAYQLAVVCDDAAAGVTEVVRGDDLIASTPRQIHLQRLLGLPTPAYAHHPLLVDRLGRRLSKRDRDLDVGAIRNKGVSGAQVVGFLALASGLRDTSDPVEPAELAADFSWDKVASTPIDVYSLLDEVR